jgi:hypothetical protein
MPKPSGGIHGASAMTIQISGLNLSASLFFVASHANMTAAMEITDANMQALAQCLQQTLHPGTRKQGAPTGVRALTTRSGNLSSQPGDSKGISPRRP